MDEAMHFSKVSASNTDTQIDPKEKQSDLFFFKFEEMK